MDKLYHKKPIKSIRSKKMKFNIYKFCTIIAEKEITLSELSRQTKIDTANLSRYKRGQREPNLKNIGKIAKDRKSTRLNSSHL